MIIKDDRTPEQKETHTWLVIGTDSFMSGWGKAEGGVSYACWACRPDDSARVFNWVDGRHEMKRVRETFAKDYRPRGTGHCHIYVVEEGHPALS